MQTLRLLSAVVVVTLCASTFSIRAKDTPAQAAARAALMQDMNDTGNAETSNPPPATPVQPPPSAPPAAAPVPPPPPPAAESVPPPPPPMTVETNTQVATPAPAATMPAAASGSSKNLVLPPVEQEVVPTNQVTQYPVNPAPVANTNNNAAQSAAMSELTGQTTGNNESPSAPGITPSPAADQPVTAPPLPISDSQRQQLQALLQQYMANQITPAQYQAGRAKILSGQ